MKVKSLYAISEDFKKATMDWNDGLYDSYSIQHYFDNAHGQIPLANPYGSIACNEYIEFVSSALFPCDGSWVGLDFKGKSTEQRTAGVKLLSMLSKKLAETNFYNEITKLVKDGTLYNKGLIETAYKHGALSFTCVSNKEIVVSTDTDENYRRLYWTKSNSILEIMDEFTNTGDTRLNTLRKTLKESPDLGVEPKDIVTAILPCTEDFFDKPKKTFRFKRVYFLHEGNGLEQIFKKDAKDEGGYKTFPFMVYLPHLRSSLASLALPYCMSINNYEELTIDLNRRILNPPIVVGYEQFTSNTINLSENGITPAAVNERTPQPIESSQRPTIGREDIIQLQQLVDKVFKLPLIQRTKITNVSQFEAATNELTALKAIQPATADLVTRITLNLLTRVHSLLKQENKDYRLLALECGSDPEMVGVSGKMQRLELAASIGRFMQGATPVIQADPSALHKIDTDKTLEELAGAWKLSDIIKSDEEVKAERQQMQQQMQQQKAVDQQNVQADTNLKQGQAEQTIRGG